MLKSPIVARINALLAQKGIQKKDFYSACGITSATYSQWNTGEIKAPREKSLKRIADFLGVSLEYLLYGDGAEKEKAPAAEGEGLSAAKKALLVAIDDLSDAQCEKLLPIVLSAKQVL